MTTIQLVWRNTYLYAGDELVGWIQQDPSVSDPRPAWLRRWEKFDYANWRGYTTTPSGNVRVPGAFKKQAARDVVESEVRRSRGAV